MEELETMLKNDSEKIGRVIPLDLNKVRLFVFDFSASNKELQKVDISSAEEFDRYVKEVLRSKNATVGIGRYNEDRIIYRHSSLFEANESESRTTHLGIDIILPHGTKILTPLDAVVHSFRNNRGMGDYGPTIILQHQLNGTVFYTLYGHLSEESLQGRFEGQKIKKGEVIGWIGDTEVNGGWFEHVHFQIISDMRGKEGDFPGVVSGDMREKYLKICPDPNLILKINNDI